MNNTIKEILNKDIHNLSYDRVWNTKKARMEAEKRMNNNNLIGQIIINYYSFWILAFSIISLGTDINLSISTVIASVGLFGLSIFMSTFNYKEKALHYKQSYLELNSLESELKSLKRELETSQNDTTSMSRQILNCERKYTDILSKTDNHDEMDHLKVDLNHNNDQVPLKKKVKFYTYFYFLKPFLITLAILIPIALLIFFLTKELNI